ncbi:8747_t:CDS:1, partial [Racocetra persica]
MALDSQIGIIVFRTFRFGIFSEHLNNSRLKATFPLFQRHITRRYTTPVVSFYDDKVTK